MTDTTALEYTTIHDWRPTHKQPPEYLTQAQRRFDAAEKAYHAHIESVLLGNGTPWEPLLTQLADICNQAEAELLACKRQWGLEQAEMLKAGG